MSKKLNNNELKAIGFWDMEVLKDAGKLAKALTKDGTYTKEIVLDLLKKMVKTPENYLEDEVFNPLAQAVQAMNYLRAGQKPEEQDHFIKDQPEPYTIYGKEQIEKGALDQMNTAMRLPVSVAGSLMPDAHQGYGLPIGGVLATSANAIIPYAVGVDIACRMCLSIWELDAIYLDQKKAEHKRMILENSFFGMGGHNGSALEDEVWENPNWKATAFIRHLIPKAKAQIGTSGTGNHFVEWGILEVLQETEDLANLPVGKYMALLTHSGSRGFGAAIANHYSKLASQFTKLPKEAQHLAWLDLKTEAGQEYWISMNLAGEYASANHHQIHRRMAKALGRKPAVMIENHHNFAWKEELPDGTGVMVHRKGATPAGKGVLGIIPGSMANPGFVVRGKGEAGSINSASHGAGRLMSRTKALASISQADMKKILADQGVTLIGGDLDEAPMAYKNIETVIAAQSDLIEVLAKFQPKIVRMADPDKRAKREE
jgi:tRNA-splicing ligase RtcB (3'-phosphate/5'-hydroxy nucleic acid ligase)